jgi:hypothetical protein
MRVLAQPWGAKKGSNPLAPTTLRAHGYAETMARCDSRCDSRVTPARPGSTNSTRDPRLLRVVSVLVVAGVLDEFAAALLGEFPRLGESHPVEVL